MSTIEGKRRRIGLASWLGGGSIVIVLVAVAAIAAACSILLGQLVERQALTRAELAAASARELLRRVGEEALDDARVLSERPTLQRMLASAETTGLGFFLKRFCESSRADVCAVRGPGGTVGYAGPTVVWESVDVAIAEQGERFILAPREGGTLLWGAAVEVPGFGGTRAIAMRLASPALLEELGRQAGARIRLTSFATYEAQEGGTLARLHAAALADGRSAALHLAERPSYAATAVVAAPTGEVLALLDAEIGSEEFAATTTRFNRILLVSALLVAGIAGLGGVLYGRWLARPVIALRDAASRIGRGDFSAAVPPVAPSEVDALARTMDEMRRNLIELTDSLRSRDAESRAVLAGVTEGVFAVDEQRVIRYANPQVARLLGRPEDEVVGRFCGDVLEARLPDGRRPCESDCPILRARGGIEARAAEKLCLRDGTTRSVVIVSAPPVGGRQVQVLRDESELEAARRARDGVLGNISHEFRTPLAAQLASIELLREGLATMTPEAQRELLANVERGVLRLMRLIDNLLESVRIEAGQLDIRHQAVDIEEVVEDAYGLIEPLLAQRALAVERDLPSIERRIAGDAQRLVQVFVNLLANAIKFAPAGSTIHLGAQTNGEWLDTWVENEGVEVAGSDRETIFERFQRSAGAEPDAPGLGLGLWIVKSIVDRHGGSVRVERTAAQRTRFTVTLPLEAAA